MSVAEATGSGRIEDNFMDEKLAISLLHGWLLAIKDLDTVCVWPVVQHKMTVAPISNVVNLTRNCRTPTSNMQQHPSLAVT